MQTVDVVLKVPKESKEVVDAAVGLVADVKAKKPIAEIAANALPKVVIAVDGFDQLDDEAKSQQKSDLAAYLAKAFLDALGV